MLLGGFCAVMMNVLVRLAAQRMHPFEVTFFRCLFSLFLMLPFIIRTGPSLLSTRRWGCGAGRRWGSVLSASSSSCGRAGSRSIQCCW